MRNDELGKHLVNSTSLTLISKIISWRASSACDIVSSCGFFINCLGTPGQYWTHLAAQ